MNTNPTVLIADDDPDFRELIKDYLSEAGYTVVEAGDGDEALRLAFEKPPDVLLLDVMMPGKNGFDVCKHIRNNDRTRGTSVVMLTVRNQLSDKLTAYISGAQRFLNKTCDLSDIDSCLKTVLKQKDIRKTQFDQDIH